MGESPERVFNVGAIGVDNINRLNLLSREELEKAIDFHLGKKNLLVTYHPVTLESSTAKQSFGELLSVLDELEDTHLIFTKANADTDGRIINQMIDGYVSENSDRSIAFTSMGQLRYLSAMKYVDGVVGNSSSGLLEAPSFQVGTVNIGDRQKGRIRAESVIDCEPRKQSISSALKMLFSDDFRNGLSSTVNPYGLGGTVDRIVKVILDSSQIDSLKKSFFDVQF